MKRLGHLERWILKTAYLNWLEEQKTPLSPDAEGNSIRANLLREVLSGRMLTLKLLNITLRRRPPKNPSEAATRYRNCAKYVRRAAKSLIKQGLFEPFSYSKFRGLKLTNAGKEAARRLYLANMLQDEAFVKRINTALRETLVAMAEEHVKTGKSDYASLEVIRENLWPHVTELFGRDRELFNLWAQKRLRRELKAVGCKLCQRRKGDARIWYYDLASVAGFSPQEAALKNALIHIRTAEPLARVEKSDIINALWVLYGKNFQSREEFGQCWNTRVVGRLLSKMGFKL